MCQVPSRGIKKQTQKYPKLYFQTLILKVAAI